MNGPGRNSKLVSLCSLVAILALSPVGTKAADQYPLEDWAYIEDRKKAHTEVYVGHEIPKMYQRYLSALIVKARNLHTSPGVSAESSFVLKQSVDKLDVDAVARASRAHLVEDLCTGPVVTAVDLGYLMNQIETVEVEAVAQRLTDATAKLDTESSEYLSGIFRGVIANTRMVVTDYAGLASDVPNYVRHLAESSCVVYKNGPPSLPAGLLFPRQSESEASGTLEVDSVHGD